MCGVFGAIHLRGWHQASAHPRFVELTDLVSYRGPDDSGHLALDVKGGGAGTPERFDVFLGHRRLSIIDLSPDGRNPLADDEGRWIIFVGEIFNYIELREELKARGQRFKTATDTEVILKVYAEHGEAGFDRLNGMWTFAIADVPGRRVVLSRDRFSIKPLYLAQHGDVLYFASEAKQLLPLLPRRSLNRPVMYQYLTQALLDHSSATFFEGITTLDPKHSLVVDLARGTVNKHRYWDYRLEDEPGRRDAVERFRALFLDSVRIRLRSDVTVGALLSGGLDSSAVAVVANHLLDGGLRTYSVVAEEERFSERRFIDELTRRTGMHNQQLWFRSAEASKALDRVVWHNDEPVLGLSIVAQYQIFEKIRQETDVTVLLSGQGGDECLLGYRKFFFFHLQDLLRRGRVWQAFRQLLGSLLSRTVVRQFNLAEARRYLPGREHFPYVRLRGEQEPLGRRQSLSERQRLDLDRYSVPALTHSEDRNSMAHSLEVRQPFLDHRLVELLLSLSVDLKLRDGWTKYVLRAALPELPEAIRWRRDKQGFLTPEEAWLREDLRPRVLGLFPGSLLHRLGVVDEVRFLDYYQRFLKGDPLIWCGNISRVLFAELWARTFLNE